MPTTNPLGIRLPVVSDAPDVTGDLTRVVEDESPKLVPAFNTEADRNTAFAAVGFKQCTVGSVLWLRKGAVWDNVLTTKDVDTDWLAPNMATGWAQLGTNPAKYRISGGMLYLDGSALYNLDGATTMPANVGLLSLPSNALPSNIANFQTYAHSQAVVATGLTVAVFARGLVNLRPGGSLVVTLPDGQVNGVRCVGLGGVQWRLKT